MPGDPGPFPHFGFAISVTTAMALFLPAIPRGKNRSTRKRLISETLPHSRRERMFLAIGRNRATRAHLKRDSSRADHEEQVTTMTDDHSRSVRPSDVLADFTRAHGGV